MWGVDASFRTKEKRGGHRSWISEVRMGDLQVAEEERTHTWRADSREAPGEQREARKGGAWYAGPV